MQLKVKKPFAWAHRGCDIVRYEAGQSIETDDADLIRVATSEGWAEEEGQKAAKVPENKARKAAPENK